VKDWSLVIVQTAVILAFGLALYAAALLAGVPQDGITGGVIGIGLGVVAILASEVVMWWWVRRHAD
jgi:hypothetical protein